MKLGLIDFFAISLGIQAVWTLYKYRRNSRQNLLIKRVRSTKISQARAGEDVWVTGKIKPGQIFVTPHFNHEAVQYSYSRFHRIVRYETDGNGGERRNETWNLQVIESNGAVFHIEDDSGQIQVPGDKAATRYPLTDFWEDNYYKHELSYIPSVGNLSVVGTVSNQKDQLLPGSRVPLVMSPLGRLEFNARVQAEDATTKYIALFFVWISSASALFSANKYFQIISTSEGIWLSALSAGGVAVVLALWVYLLFIDQPLSLSQGARGAVREHRA